MMSNNDTRLPSKLGQPPVGSPRTLESRRKLANLFGSYLSPQTSSPLSKGSSHSASARLGSPPASQHAGSAPASSFWKWMSPSGSVPPGPQDFDNNGHGDGHESLPTSLSRLQIDRDGGDGDESLAYIFRLPDDLLLHILSYLPSRPSQLCTLSLISRRFAYLSHSPVLWSGVFDARPTWSILPSARDSAIGTREPPAGEWDGLAWRWDREEGPDHVRPPRPRENYIPPDAPWTDDSTYSGVPSDDSSSGHSASGPASPVAESDPQPTANGVQKTALHYPTLCHSRFAFSHQLREPSIDHPTHKATLIKHTDSVYCLIIRGDWMISGSRDRSIRIWRLGAIGVEGNVGPTKCVRHIPNAHEGSILSLDLELHGERGTLISGSSDCTASVWDVDFRPVDGKRPKITHVRRLSGHQGGILDVLLAKDRIVTASKDSTVRIWSREPDEGCLHILHHQGSVNGIALRPGAAQFVSVSGDSSWIIWDLYSGEEVRKVEAGAVLACVAWKGDWLVTGDSVRSIKLWSPTTGELVRSFNGHTDLVRAVGINEKEGILVSGSYDRSLRMWDIHTGELIRKFAPHHSSQIFDLDVTTTRLASASHDNSIQLMTFGTGLPYLALFD